ncbi:uncharacterized protein BDZ99DRAFT_570138 [Mytilinidion resinicola]|uniref:Uncharacterized protein n=1 Tax=Mytilinidion resinicola TaxID=574789 RepID=A0A6A6YSE0_9PEZI|nr:uncharacterized protein BDZ99DRAFT_570138 [Mytilinidion resinicola]KAF2810827.1 hypothetical protein BDZ99DRAFT_570138 [Mytilinidion resinicola]
MKNVLVPLLLHLSLNSLAAADVPTFTQKDPKSYIGTTGATVNPGPGDIVVSEGDGTTITFGTDISAKIHNVLKSSCANPQDDNCKKQLHDTMGIGPTADGLQKRFLAGLAILGGLALAYIIPIVIEYVWLDKDENLENIIQIDIPQDQVDEVSKWQLDEFVPTFDYKPMTGNGFPVAIDTAQPKPQNIPGTTKEANGDVTVNVQGLDQAIKDSWTKVICERDGKRSLNKRVTMQCIVQYAQAIMRIAQVGGPAADIMFVSPKDFPQPKNQLLVEALKEDDDYANDLVLGGGLAAGARGSISEFATWMAFGYSVGNIAFTDGKMKFSAQFLDQQLEIPTGNCPDAYYTPYCDNCGGNAIADDLTTYKGKCKGFSDDENSYFKNCPCYLSITDPDGYITDEELQISLDFLKHLPEESDDQQPTQICYKADTDRMKDHQNWKFVEQVSLDANIETFCGNDWIRSPPATGNWTSEMKYNQGDGDWNAVTISVYSNGNLSPQDVRSQCETVLKKLSAGCDHDDTLNQFNLKWGGTYQDANAFWTISPDKPRVYNQTPPNNQFDTVPNAHLCNQYTKYSDHGNTGLNGKVIDDPAKMALQMCIHSMQYLKDNIFVGCGGYMSMGIKTENYNSNVKECAANTWQCLSYWVENGQTAEGKYFPGFAQCSGSLGF